MSNASIGGASISARIRTPSLDLARVCEALSEALGDEHPPSASFLRYEGDRLRLNLIAPLQALFKLPAFTTDLAPGQDCGFLRDLEAPPFGTAATVGGRLLPGSEKRTTAALVRLHQHITKQLDLAVDENGLRALVAKSQESVLSTLAEHLDTEEPAAPTSATLVPIGFALADRKAAERENDVARVFSAIEVVEGRDWLESLQSGIRTKLKRDGLEEDEIEPILSSLKAQREQTGSQLNRFLDFLDDDALSRVRLQVTFRIMGAVARASASMRPGLRTYICRVFDCFKLFADSSGTALPLDPSALLGQRATTDLSEQLRKATFYNCLPAWPEWSAQLFESRLDPDKGFAVYREVSYRFRVNGNNPDTGKSAFASRLDRIENNLDPQAGSFGRAARSMAELVFLRLVVPDSADSPTGGDVSELSAAIAHSLKTDPAKAIKDLLRDLRDRERVMNDIAGDLIQIIKQKSKRLIVSANRNADKFYIAVHRSMVNWTALVGMSSKSTEVLVKNEDSDERIGWFQHLSVTENPSDLQALASYSVETHLWERSLAPTGERYEVTMLRQLASPTLPVRFVPFERFAKGEAPKPIAATAKLELGHGVEVEFSTKLLTLTKSKDDKIRSESLRAAACSAVAVLVYLVLWELVRRLKGIPDFEGMTMTILRLQETARDAEPTDGDAAIYCICQALERALNRELFVKQQGFHLQGSPSTERFRKTGILAALKGGFPIRFATTGSLDRVAVLSYVTRPCDRHPANPNADGYLFVCRTYCATRYSDGMDLRVEHMQSRLVDSEDAFREPHLIEEEVARLRAKGYHHVVLLSHHYGNRHIGRAAERHAPHGTREFLEGASQKFPDVYLYPLRRDVFPATRLRTRAAMESAFEVTAFADQQRMYEDSRRDLLRGFQPIYTFATLAVVTESGRPQSGFCTYYFDIEQRLTNLEWSEVIRQNLLGSTAGGRSARASILEVLRGIHYLEAERIAGKSQALPVLDPFGWAMPPTKDAAGELEIMRSRKRGVVYLSFPALLANVTKVLHKSSEIH